MWVTYTTDEDRFIWRRCPNVVGKNLPQSAEASFQYDYTYWKAQATMLLKVSDASINYRSNRT